MEHELVDPMDAAIARLKRATSVGGVFTANRLQPVSHREVAEAEAALGRRFPDALVRMWLEAGRGVLALSEDGERGVSGFPGRFLRPAEVVRAMAADGADRVSGLVTEREVPIFDTGSGVFCCLLPRSSMPEAVFFAGCPDEEPDPERLVADDLAAFLDRLLDDPDFLASAIAHDFPDQADF